ncbi:MAG: class I SAM-dependent methyltransferase [Acidobacteriota bacterium]
MSGESRSLGDLFSRWGGRKGPAAEPEGAAGGDEAAHPTKALPPFLKGLAASEGPVLIDLGPVVGSNVTFFGEQLGCRLRVEDVIADIERHARSGATADFPGFLETRLQQAEGSVDGILCWDVFDYLDRPAAQALAASLVRMLRPGGLLLGFFSNAEPREQVYTKYVVVDEAHLKYRQYPASAPRQRGLLNRDIIKLFEGLTVSESFLMKNNVREFLFRK